MGYTQKAISGFSWQTVLKLFQSGLVVIKISILARLLSPTDFGTFSLITIALGVVEAFTQTGVNFTILQSKRSIKYFVDTAWVIAIIRGFCIGILMTVLGIGMGHFYNMPDLPFYIALAALVPIIKGFINPSIVTLHKNLEFFKDSSYRISLTVVDVFLAVVFGLWLRSFVAMIFAMIGAAVFEVFISFVFFAVRPKFRYIPSRAKAIYANAKWLSVSALLSYAHENLDNLILGKTLGTHSLGLYHNGYSIGHKVNYDISKSAFHGTLPIYTKIVDDVARLRRAFLRSSVVTLSIAAIGTLPLIAAPKLVVSILLGPEWVEVTKYLPLLGIAGLLQAITMQGTSILMASKKFVFVNLQLAIAVSTMVPLMYMWSKEHYIAGAAAALIASRIIALPLIGLGLYKTLFKQT